MYATSSLVKFSTVGHKTQQRLPVDDVLVRLGEEHQQGQKFNYVDNNVAKFIKAK
jgi:cytochrome c1